MTTTAGAPSAGGTAGGPAPGRAAERVDAALVGVGGAGLVALHHLALGLLRGRPRAAPLRVALVDDVERLAPGPDGTRPRDRTWCFWEAAPAAAPAVARSWGAVEVVSDGGRLALDVTPLRYRMLRGEDLYALVDGAVQEASAAGRLHLVRRPAATAVEDGPRRALVRTPGGDLSASWVLDSRPSPPLRPARTALLQHFRGEVVRTDPAAPPVFDPRLPVLMDFRTPQPAVGLSFGYCLPLDGRTALVEYTEFSPAVLDDAGYARGLAAYRGLLGLRPDGGDARPDGRGPDGAGLVEVVAVEHAEQGVIPMADDVRTSRAGARVRRLGTAGGATRPSTGYTFSALQRQGAAVAQALLAGRDPVPPRAYPPRHRWMDSLVLRGLASGALDGPDFFTRLFAGNPPDRVLRFLDGSTTRAEELALMASAPRALMTGLALQDAAVRVGRRLRSQL
ncbi:lycopene cyclase family protein [uncultured Pseudokineococcus sp.]|uniref:lycopene cyclase family protein n=1 Tax=uncultured Pseudokineococcus sp. TaxID=1642928 RepID=UPI00262569DE|nr:lycopene cyclase family protein [uncultured Pseudokineococcus sp.]